MVSKKKVAVVTGASRGIGYEVARQLLGEGYNVVICSRDARAVNRAAKKLGPNCVGLVCDVSDAKSVRVFVSKVVKKFGRVDVLINNAGIAVWKDFVDQSMEEISSQVAINLTGLMLMTSAFLPSLSGGVIVNIASGAGKHAHPGLAPYCATKWGVRGFTQTLARELTDIKVYAVNPGTTATGMTDFRGTPVEKVADIVIGTIKGKYKVASGGDVDVWEYV